MRQFFDFFPTLPNQLRVFQALPDQTGDSRIDLIHGVHWSHVVPIGELVDVTLKVLDGHPVINPVVSTLQERPEGLDAVSVSLISHELPNAVMDPFVAVS